DRLITAKALDDHPAILNGLRMILSDFQDIHMQGTYTDGNQLLESLQSEQPDILFLDIQLIGTDGISVCKRVLGNWPSIRVIVFTNCEEKHYVRNMLQNGAMGYLLKTADGNTIRTAIDTVMEGEQFIHSELKEQLFQQMLTNRKPSRYTPGLTKREKEILQLIAQGLRNQEIADKLSLSVRTIENHRFNLIQKLQVNNAAALIRKAIDLGLAD
ncbi:MAG: response regulator transcription factor, partial [Chitinophagaceae bacterium]|nr:response regulator transcription factor [Chitinophagaceae bacterium]